MKYYKNKTEFYKTLQPLSADEADKLNSFKIYSQEKFNRYLVEKGAEEAGELNKKEIEAFNNIKKEIKELIDSNPGISKDRLDFDLAIIFHSNLKKLNWGKYLINDYGMWRWLSLNYFLKEVYWRRGEDFYKKGYHLKSAKSVYTHIVGTRTRDIFPRRYFLIGDRLFDPDNDYKILEALSKLCKESSAGGYGNLILNLIDTKLISPNDHVSKTISQLLFNDGHLANDKEVVRAFTRYNGYKRRLINGAPKAIFENEICIG